MGGSSIKKIFRKKKSSRWKKAWKKMKKALPTKKRKKRSNPLLDKLNPSKKKSSEKEKEPKSLKRVFLGLNAKKEPSEDATPAEKKDEGALGKLREQIKRKACRQPSNGLSKAEEVPSPVNLEETKEQNHTGNPRNEERDPKRKLKDIMKSIRPTRSRTNEVQEKEA